MNAIIEFSDNQKIKDLTIVDPYNIPMLKGMKDSFVDVKAVLDNDKTLIIEMQVLNHKGFEKRILYNAAKFFSIQLDKKQDYNLLNPVIALSIVDFEMVPDNWDKELEKALTTVNEANLSKRELEIQYKRKEFIYIQNNTLAFATEKVEKIGQEIRDKRGEKRGQKIGEKRGEKRGGKNKQIEIAKNLLDILDDTIIAKKTGLVESVVCKLRKK